VTSQDDAGKIRLDELVQQRCGVSRSKAQGLIRTGKVRGADGQPLDRPGRTVSSNLELTIVGASTGGFTDCLLQRGAAKVYAVDVGYGQLDWKLRQDPRVVVMERTNIREMTPEALPERPEFFTVDCSFISLRIVLPALWLLLADTAEGVALIKPQFEAGREEVGRGGVVRDPAVHNRVIEDMREASERAGFETHGVINSPLEGPAGNREFLAHLVVRR
jgi:23S rRNA (cytidine1920-2'-O)/16S rRNA (cytidine1409-2'-O)-methyltransferase